MIGPNCPGVLSPGKANAGIIPAEIFTRGERRARLALGHADVPDRTRADPARSRQLDDRRDRRRPGRRLLVHRRRRVFEADPRDRAHRACRRDRRRRGGEGRGVRRRARDEAGARVHRGLLGAARQDDGPRGRDHLRLLGHGAGKKEALEARGIEVGTTPTEVAQMVAARLK